MEAIAKGILSGMGYGLLLGPLFFLNIRITLSHGFKHGIALVAGAFSSDCLLVFTSWWGAERLTAISTDSDFQRWFGLFCGLLLLFFGLSAAFSRKRDLSGQLQGDVSTLRRRYSFIKGWLINSTNPSNWLFWLSVATVAKSEAPADDASYARFFMTASLLTLFLTDVSKVLLAHQIRRWLKPGVPEKIIRVAGAILVALSGWILLRVFQNW